MGVLVLGAYTVGVLVLGVFTVEILVLVVYTVTTKLENQKTYQYTYTTYKVVQCFKTQVTTNYFLYSQRFTMGGLQFAISIVYMLH